MSALLCQPSQGGSLFGIVSADGGGCVRFWEVGDGGEGRCVRQVRMAEEGGFVSCILEERGRRGRMACLVGMEKGGLFRVDAEGEVESVIEVMDGEGVEDMMWIGEELYVVGERGKVKRYAFVDGGFAREVEQVVGGLSVGESGRISWMRGQGKKDMIEGWKGKKRRYEQVGAGGEDGVRE